MCVQGRTEQLRGVSSSGCVTGLFLAGSEQINLDLLARQLTQWFGDFVLDEVILVCHYWCLHYCFQPISLGLPCTPERPHLGINAMVTDSFLRRGGEYANIT